MHVGVHNSILSLWSYREETLDSLMQILVLFLGLGGLVPQIVVDLGSNIQVLIKWSHSVSRRIILTDLVDIHKAG